MVYTKRIVSQLAATLLKELSITYPTPAQCKAAESFVVRVILPPTDQAKVPEGLTATEWLCLNLAAGGFSIKKTAKKLSLTPGTIKNYRERIREKLHCKNMPQAVYKAFVLTENKDSVHF